MSSYDHTQIEQKWQKKWEKEKLYATTSSKNKKYILDMFPYPSGDGLHVGHVEGYTATDIYSRYLRMNGHSVLHPMGWDAFGLPAENFAIKTGIHPEETTKKASDTFRRQIKSLGLSYDWEKEIDTHSPEYYKWTQWLFLKLFEKGLAYKKKAKVNWCESCKTVLANEQVINGACERCKNEVVQKELEQWFFKITDFAEDLISDLETVDWPESTILNQRNWIGKSEGAELSFSIKGADESLNVFTTRPDTLFGATYMVVAPEHPIIEKFFDRIANRAEVEAYRKKAFTKTDLERTMEEKEKTGVQLEGVNAVNPATKAPIPIFVADYVLGEYGTGAIMAVPAHDERDYAFAKKFKLPVVEVVSGGDIKKSAYTGEGTLMNSDSFDGMDSGEARSQITKSVGGTPRVTYRLRDWLISRQRYWGVPIPIVYDQNGKPTAVPEEHLPWLLPTDVAFKPTGVSPLALSKELQERTQKLFGEGYTPEVDTMDTFVCSSWYYFRYTDPHNKTAFADKRSLKTWMPVDLYMGGAEHTVLHLLYARFVTKFLRSLGYTAVAEPFQKLRHQGIILAPDGRKMSKSLGNVINPDDVVRDVGADALRVYEMFMGPLDQAIPWSTDNMVGSRRFLDRVWRLSDDLAENAAAELTAALHRTVKKVGEDIEALKFNTAISEMMKFVNVAEKAPVDRTAFRTFLTILAPFAPHLAEELWERSGGTASIHREAWPAYDEKYLKEEAVTVAIQVNGKVRETLTAAPGSKKEEILEKALKLPKIRKYTEGQKVAQTIYIQDKVLNIVIKLDA